MNLVVVRFISEDMLWTDEQQSEFSGYFSPIVAEFGAIYLLNGLRLMLNDNSELKAIGLFKNLTIIFILNSCDTLNEL